MNPKELYAEIMADKERYDFVAAARRWPMHVTMTPTAL